MSEALVLNAVCKTYRTGGETVDALRRVNLRVQAGRFLCVTGPSGSGKTTLLKVSAGYLAPDEGKVWIFDQDVYELSIGERLALRNRIVGFMFQENLLLEDLTAFENVELPLVIQGVVKNTREDRVRRALRSVGIPDLERRRPDEVSGGERRRISLARSLVNGCRILFVDEPTSNLDSTAAGAILDMLRHLNQLGLTIVAATHDPLVAQRADENVKMRDGKTEV